MTKIDLSNLKESLPGICVIEVSGESCANCLSLMPVLNELVSNRTDCKLVHVEVDNNTMDFVEHYDIQAVPTILITLDGEVKARCKGYQPEEILELWLDAKIEEIKSLK
ncbi:MAG: thioredoxin family protein [Anaeroplasmataceae bacterium]